MVKDYNAPPITRQSSDTMEETVERPFTAIGIPDKVDAEKFAATNDKESNKNPEEKEANEEKDGSLKDYFRVFTYASTADRILYSLGLAGAIIVGAALPLMTLVFGQSTAEFNQQATGQDSSTFTSNINNLVLYFVYIFVARFLIGYLGTLCICIAAARTTCALREDFLDKLLRQDVAHFDKGGSGSAATQVTTNGNRINQGIAEKLFICVQGISLFLSGFIVALSVQWKLALIVMSIIPAIFLITGVCIGLDAPIEARVTKIYSQAGTLAQDAISSIRTIHAFGAHQKIVDGYESYLRKAHKEGNKKSVIYGVLFSSQTFLVMSGTSLAFWQGFRMFQSGEIGDVGTVFTVVLSVVLGATATLLIFPQFQAFTNASSAAGELFLIIDSPSTLDPLSVEGWQPSSCNGEIIVHDLRFAYPARPSAQVLQGLSLSIPAGKTTALVGPSGCGKSTLVGLLERWYQPTSGQILLDGRDISEYNTKWLRSNIRLIQQEPTLFQGTIFENVVKGLIGDQKDLPAAKQMKLVQEACKNSNAHDFIEALPEGYHTQVGERASMLSGGQRQRISIARSIISNPKILLFDEATSALDPRAEKVVQSALNRVSINKTTLIIAHKLATVMAADNIVVMKDGQIYEQGTHHELIKSDGLYAAMVRAQDLGTKANDEDIQKELLETQNVEDSLDRKGALQRTQSHYNATELEREVEHLAAGTLGYSLIKCIWIMLKENFDLRYWYAATIVGGIIGGGTYPAQAIIFSRLVRVFTLQGSEAQEQANFWALMFFVLALANLFAYFAIGLACNSIGQTLTHRYRKEMIERIISFDQEFFDRPENSSGALTSKLSSAPTALQELMSANLGLMFNILVNITASSALGIAYGWKLGLTLVFGGLTIIVAAGYYRIRIDQKLEVATEEQFPGSAGLATEAVTSIRTVSMLTLETSIMRQYSDTLQAITRKVIKSLTFALLPYALSQSADFLVMALGFWYGSRLIASGEYNTSQFFVIFIAIVFGAANYILWLRTVKPNIRESDETNGKGPSSDGVIAMEDVEFRYKQRNASRVLRGISMKIKPGAFAAFVGPSDCGKSTVVSLLLRFYDPISGYITLNDQNISLMSPQLYRRYMSLVQQEPPLYLGSVRDNIALGLEHEPSDAEIQEACRQANVLEFVASLPEGLQTPCGSKGLQFSGGQRQRIAIARALIRQPRLLLLDEATSALDTQSERIVQKVLDEAAMTRTTIAVAHRLSTIRHADVIFVMEDGVIAEMGTHEELQRLRGRYFATCLAQSLDQA
ncbi:ATP-binding cassette, subfamily B (MDR/TAP), member 1 [Alternaria panax]|uniref:ATP-binding cassette, subfamily B (MDR/TAP), member 1 n=1 Tax=Alternaria panax TaxID=48097 RepID=A0AAD4FL27_9PLEO|nr:ATP-binding cassette, subfamily B (MDR/TAP), member 1 [Alternaria panax]